MWVLCRGPAPHQPRSPRGVQPESSVSWEDVTVGTPPTEPRRPPRWPLPAPTFPRPSAHPPIRAECTWCLHQCAGRGRPATAPGDTRGCRSGGCSWHPWALLNILRAQDAPRPRMSDRNPGSIPAQSQVFTPKRGSSDRIVPPSGPKPVALPPWPPTGHPPLHLGPRTWGPVRSRLGPGSGRVGLCSRFTLEQPGGRRNWPGTLLTLSRARGRLGPGPAGGQASLQLPSALQTPSRPHEVARAWAGQRPGLWPRTQ